MSTLSYFYKLPWTVFYLFLYIGFCIWSPPAAASPRSNSTDLSSAISVWVFYPFLGDVSITIWDPACWFTIAWSTKSSFFLFLFINLFGFRFESYPSVSGAISSYVNPSGQSSPLPCPKGPASLETLLMDFSIPALLLGPRLFSSRHVEIEGGFPPFWRPTIWELRIWNS